MNTQRRYKDRNDNQFMPMNVEGQDFNDNFMKPYKLIVIALIMFGMFVIGAYLTSTYASIKAYIACYILYIFICSYIVRYVIFEEKYYYNIYKERKDKQITTPATFWKVASIKDSIEGAIITYADLKVGVVIKLDRGSITGRDEEFRERHFDAISDFYKELMRRKYRFVYINSMEPSGKDPRLVELDKLVSQATNKNIHKLLTYQVGHIKRIAQNSSYETEYYLIYTTDISKSETILSDCIDTALTLLDGAYINFSFLNKRELNDLDKEKFGVQYFNATEASLSIYNNGNVANSEKPFLVKAIEWDDGYIQNLNNNKYNKMTSMIKTIISRGENSESISFKEHLYEREEEIKEQKIRDSIGIDLSSINNNKNKGLKGLIKENKAKYINDNQIAKNQNQENKEYNQEHKESDIIINDNTFIDNIDTTNEINLDFNNSDDEDMIML